jgi:hypothetical protein
VELLGRELDPLRLGVMLGPQLVELVAPMHREIERIGNRIPLEGDDIAVARREADAVLGIDLVPVLGLETPDAAVLLEERAGGLAR